MPEPQHEANVTFAARDGWRLMGDIYRSPDPRMGILISAGTGFPRGFYDAAARYWAARGAVVLTYDYRGIGGSAAADIARSGIDYPDWGHLDMPAALDRLGSAAPGLPLVHVAHSVGGHFLGLMPNHHMITRHAFLSVGTGYFGGHQLRNLPAEFYFWWGLGSYALARHRYIKPIGGWQGEPLPPNLFRTWRRWSHRRAYFRPDYDTLLAPQHYSAVTAPIRSWVFRDDPIATPRAAADLLACYPNAPSNIQQRSAADFGLRRIGHDGAFRKGREAVWNEVWGWLSGDSTQATRRRPSTSPHQQEKEPS
ncbi:serine aminopeptidase domain-containing protein [Microbulbifer sp. S227A]|uniref:alpha/beta hydrolase family protein n=1 Tax=Microbulbifer sp. S227A TaxID=3415131 RepID=UPI003C7A2337